MTSVMLVIGNITARKHIITRAKDQRMAYFTLVLIGQKDRNMQSKNHHPRQKAFRTGIDHMYIPTQLYFSVFTNCPFHFFIGIQQQQSTIKVKHYQNIDV